MSDNNGLMIEVDAKSPKADNVLKKLQASLGGVEKRANSASASIDKLSKALSSGGFAKASSQTQRTQRDFAQVEKSVKNIEKTTNSATEAVGKFAKSLAVGLGAAGAFYSLKQISSEFGGISNKIAQITGRTRELERVQWSLYQSAENTRTSIKGTADVFSSFGRSLRHMNLANDRLVKLSETVQKSLALSGASAESAAAAITQLGQGLAAGALRGEELNSVMEQASRLSKALTDELGITTGQLRKMGEEGKITADVIFRALERQAHNINEEFKVLRASMSQGVSLFSESTRVWVAEFDKGLGLSRMIGGNLLDMSKRIRESAKGAKELGQSFQIAASRAQAVFEKVGQRMTPKIKRLGKQMQDAYIKYLPLDRESDNQVFDTRMEELLTRTRRAFVEYRRRYRAGGWEGVKYARSQREQTEYDWQVSKPKHSVYTKKYGIDPDELVERMRLMRGESQNRLRQIAFNEKRMEFENEATRKVQNHVIRFRNQLRAVHQEMSGIPQEMEALISRDKSVDFKHKDVLFIKLEAMQKRAQEAAKEFKAFGTKAVRPVTQEVDKFATKLGLPFDRITESVEKGKKSLQSFYDFVKKGGRQQESVAPTEITPQGRIRAAVYSVAETLQEQGLFQDATKYADQFFEAVEAGVERLKSALTKIKQFAQDVIKAFWQIWDDVIAHSWWTDTIEAVISTSKTLWSKVRNSLLAFSDGVIKIFERIYNNYQMKRGSQLRLNLTPTVQDGEVNSATEVLVKRFSEKFKGAIKSLKAAFTDMLYWGVDKVNRISGREIIRLPARKLEVLAQGAKNPAELRKMLATSGIHSIPGLSLDKLSFDNNNYAASLEKLKKQWQELEAEVAKAPGVTIQEKFEKVLQARREAVEKAASKGSTKQKLVAAPEIDLSGFSVQAIRTKLTNTWEEIKKFWEKLKKEFPTIGTIVGSALSVAFLRAFLPPSMMRNWLTAFFTTHMLWTSAVVGERLGLQFKGKSWTKAASTAAGEFVTEMFASIIKNIPAKVSLLTGALAGVGRSITHSILGKWGDLTPEDLPYVATPIKKAKNFLHKIGVADPLNFVVGSGVALGATRFLPYAETFKPGKKSFLNTILDLFGTVLPGNYAMRYEGKNADGSDRPKKEWGVRSFFSAPYRALGGWRAASWMTLLAGRMGAFDSLFQPDGFNDPNATGKEVGKSIAKWFLVFMGTVGPQFFSKWFGGPPGETTLKAFSAIKTFFTGAQSFVPFLKHMGFSRHAAAPGSIAERLEAGIPAMFGSAFDRVKTAFLTQFTTKVAGGSQSLLLTWLFGANPDQTFARIGHRLKRVFLGYKVNLIRSGRDVSGAISTLFSGVSGVWKHAAKLSKDGVQVSGFWHQSLVKVAGAYSRVAENASIAIKRMRSGKDGAFMHNGVIMAGHIPAKQIKGRTLSRDGVLGGVLTTKNMKWAIAAMLTLAVATSAFAGEADQARLANKGLFETLSEGYKHILGNFEYRVRESFRENPISTIFTGMFITATPVIIFAAAKMFKAVGAFLAQKSRDLLFSDKASKAKAISLVNSETGERLLRYSDGNLPSDIMARRAERRRRVREGRGQGPSAWDRTAMALGRFRDWTVDAAGRVTDRVSRTAGQAWAALPAPWQGRLQTGGRALGWAGKVAAKPVTYSLGLLKADTQDKRHTLKRLGIVAGGAASLAGTVGGGYLGYKLTGNELGTVIGSTVGAAIAPKVGLVATNLLVKALTLIGVKGAVALGAVALAGWALVLAAITATVGALFNSIRHAVMGDKNKYPNMWDRIAAGWAQDYNKLTGKETRTDAAKKSGLSNEASYFASKLDISSTVDISQIDKKRLSKRNKEKLEEYLKAADEAILNAYDEHRSTGLTAGTRNAAIVAHDRLESFAHTILEAQTPKSDTFVPWIKSLQNIKPNEHNLLEKWRLDWDQWKLDRKYQVQLAMAQSDLNTYGRKNWAPTAQNQRLHKEAKELEAKREFYSKNREKHANIWAYLNSEEHQRRLIDPALLTEETPRGKAAKQRIADLQANRGTVWNARFRGEQGQEKTILEQAIEVNKLNERNPLLSKRTRDAENAFRKATEDANKRFFQAYGVHLGQVGRPSRVSDGQVRTTGVSPATEQEIKDLMVAQDKAEKLLLAAQKLELDYAAKIAARREYSTNRGNLVSDLNASLNTSLAEGFIPRNASDMQYLRDLGREAKFLKDQLALASNTDQHWAIFNRMDELKRQAEQRAEMATLSDGSRKQFRLGTLMTDLGLQPFSEKALAGIDDASASRLYEHGLNLKHARENVKWVLADTTSFKTRDEIDQKLEQLRKDRNEKQDWASRINLNEKSPEYALYNSTMKGFEATQKALEEAKQQFEVDQTLNMTLTPSVQINLQEALRDLDTQWQIYEETIQSKVLNGASGLQGWIELANQHSVDFLQYQQGYGRNMAQAGVLKLSQLKREKERRIAAGNGDVKDIDKQYGKIQAQAKNAVPSLSNVLSTLSGLGSGVSFQDFSIMSDESRDRLVNLAKNLMSAEEHLNSLDATASRVEIDRHIRKKLDTAKEAAEELAKTLHATPARIIEGLQRMGISSEFEINFLSDEQINRMLQLDSYTQKLRRDLTDPANASQFGVILNRLKAAHDEAKGITQTLTSMDKFRTSLSSVFGLEVDDSLISAMGAEMFKKWGGIASDYQMRYDEVFSRTIGPRSTNVAAPVVTSAQPTLAASDFDRLVNGIFQQESGNRMTDRYGRLLYGVNADGSKTDAVGVSQVREVNALEAAKLAGTGITSHADAVKWLRTEPGNRAAGRAWLGRELKRNHGNYRLASYAYHSGYGAAKRVASRMQAAGIDLATGDPRAVINAKKEPRGYNYISKIEKTMERGNMSMRPDAPPSFNVQEFVQRMSVAPVLDGFKKLFETGNTVVTSGAETLTEAIKEVATLSVEKGYEESFANFTALLDEKAKKQAELFDELHQKGVQFASTLSKMNLATRDTMNRFIEEYIPGSGNYSEVIGGSSLKQLRANLGPEIAKMDENKWAYNAGLISKDELYQRNQAHIQRIQQKYPSMHTLQHEYAAQGSDVSLDQRALRLGSYAQSEQLLQKIRERRNLEHLAQTTTDPRKRYRAQQALNLNREQIDELQTEMSYDPAEDARSAGKDFAERVMSSFTDSIKAFAKGEKSFKEMLKDMWSNYAASVVDTMFRGMMAKSPLGKLFEKQGELIHGVWNPANKDTNAVTAFGQLMGKPKPKDPNAAPGLLDMFGFGEDGMFTKMWSGIKEFFGFGEKTETATSEGYLAGLGSMGPYTYANPMPVAVVNGGMGGASGMPGMFGGDRGLSAFNDAFMTPDGRVATDSFLHTGPLGVDPFANVPQIGSAYTDGVFGMAAPAVVGGLTGGLFGGGLGGMMGENSALTSGFDSVVGAIGESTTTQGGFFDSLGGIFSGGLEGLGSLFSKGLQGLGSLFGGGGGGGGGASGIWGMIGSFIGGLFADGGYVSGPGTSRSDSIPAMLSNGEFVINAKATRQWLPVLNSINHGQMPKFADGGLVGSSKPVYMPLPLQTNSNTINHNRQSQVFNINVSGDISRQTRAEIQRMLPTIAYGVNQHNRENN